MRIREQLGKVERRWRLIADLSRQRHLCIRELLPMMLPSRWQAAPLIETLCQQFGHSRLTLSECAVEELFPGFDHTPINVTSLPRGDWATPLTDQIVLAKFARLLQPKTILEVGSFRGHTARLLAENTPSSTIIHTLDTYSDHGEAYRNSPLEGRIKRHIGSLGSSSSGLKEAKFDFIYLDADHSLEGVGNDTKILLPMLAERGFLFWHDYSDWGWMSGWNRVPEVLVAFSQEIPILSIPGTALAVYSRGWTPEEVSQAISSWKQTAVQCRWTAPVFRG